jgi:hypothetical protein
VSVVQVGRLSPHDFVDRSNATSNTTLAQNLFLAACLTVDLQVRLPASPISCPEATGSQIKAAFAAASGDKALVTMRYTDSGCENLMMETAAGATRQSAIFGSVAGIVISAVDQYLQAILS